jgi:hypothetical protein
MTISERYRKLYQDILAFSQGFQGECCAEAERVPQQLFEKALGELAPFDEAVGEIPRIRLEEKLTPVLLKSHSVLDRARRLLDEGGESDRAAEVWELEQQIYRLLNDL